VRWTKSVFTRKHMSDHCQVYALSIRFMGGEKDIWTSQGGVNSRIQKTT